ncbi:serine/arginine-rich splicing factor SR45a-like isoform X2 [Salvia hispanica]|uniref:serine/arginine-rich splicing factor SR45a-like isoform X2 n=1 Tax=Salvia hispanica TaxID=49212 RepID=UPI002009C62A|nr:serine/arginine-rich splicing factor SR45a-like isoform X2 [Salvia hispanica]
MTKGERTSPPESRTSPRHSSRRSRSISRSRRSRSRSRSEDALNPGNNLYVTGLSTRVTETELENYFKREGKVVKCHLVRDPHSKESRGFAFVTMETNKDAEHCIKNLNRSVMEGRLITVEKAKRKRGRTPTPGKYEGVKNKRGNSWNRQRSRSYSPRRRHDRDNDNRERHGVRSSTDSRRGGDDGHHHRSHRQRS